jgi:VIT1/CCC1 family predicted Fe2+/Mn2+ transporter
MKAALLSGLVFPGLGQIYLKHHVRGVLLAFGAALAMYFIASTAVQTALDVVKKIEVGEVTLESTAITDLIAQESHRTGQATNIVTIVLGVIWVVGIVDAYRQGRALDRGDFVPEKGDT